MDRLQYICISSVHLLSYTEVKILSTGIYLYGLDFISEHFSFVDFQVPRQIHHSVCRQECGGCKPTGYGLASIHDTD